MLTIFSQTASHFHVTTSPSTTALIEEFYDSHPMLVSSEVKTSHYYAWCRLMSCTTTLTSLHSSFAVIHNWKWHETCDDAAVGVLLTAVWLFNELKIEQINDRWWHKAFASHCVNFMQIIKWKSCLDCINSKVFA